MAHTVFGFDHLLLSVAIDADHHSQKHLFKHWETKGKHSKFPNKQRAMHLATTHGSVSTCLQALCKMFVFLGQEEKLLHYLYYGNLLIYPAGIFYS